MLYTWREKGMVSISSKESRRRRISMPQTRDKKKTGVGRRGGKSTQCLYYSVIFYLSLMFSWHILWKCKCIKVRRGRDRTRRQAKCFPSFCRSFISDHLTWCDSVFSEGNKSFEVSFFLFPSLTSFLRFPTPFTSPIFLISVQTCNQKQ